MSNELPNLEWESASVQDGTLSVELAGERPEHWVEVFAQTVKLLPGGEWEEVECQESTVTVTGVRAGGEEKLAHFLESVVQQANAHFASADDKGGEDEEGENEESESSPENRKGDPDAELTARFRAFGQ